MERGLLWLPLLILFFSLVWLGQNESRKIQAYSQWAEQFEQAKYDIYSVLGQQGQELTWGIPTRKGPINLTTFSLTKVRAINLVTEAKSNSIEFEFLDGRERVRIPFTELALAQKWADYLEKVRLRDNGSALG